MLPIYKHKIILVLLLSFSMGAHSAFGQGPMITRYFDSSWNSISKDSAFYYTEIVKEQEALYRFTSYWMKSKKLNCRSSYADTTFDKPVGVLLRYYENGRLEDSTYSYPNGTVKNTYHYYDNGRLWVHYQYNLKTRNEITDAFSLNGSPIDNFIYSREAIFQDGDADWMTFLSENIKTSVPVKKGAKAGNYQVVVRFIVGSDGKIFGIQPETNLGYGMEEEIVRVIKKSPKWHNAVQMGKAVNAYRRQPITFSVEDEK